MKLNWKAFLRMADCPESRTLLATGGERPSDTRAIIERMQDGESKTIRLEMLAEMQQRHADHRYEPEGHDWRDWDSLGDGKFRRRVHL